MAREIPPQPTPQRPTRSRRRLSGRSIVLIVALAVLLIFVFQNTEEVKLKFLVFNFSWPVWLYTVFVAVFGAVVWIGLGVLRRHRRRRERREERR